MSAPDARLDPPPASILIRGVNWLGDAVMTTPAVQRLREAYPEAHIAILTHEKLADLWRDHPHIDETLTFSPTEGPMAIGRRLRARNFDLGIALPNSPRTALELWRAGIPRRAGYAGSWRSWLLTHAVPRPVDITPMRKRTATEIRRLISADKPAPDPIAPGSHHIHHYLRLVSALGASPAPSAPLLAVPDADVAEFAATFVKDADRVWLGLNPGAEYGAAKRWPADRFIDAAARVHQATGAGWIVFGAPQDREVARIAGEIARRVGADAVVNLAGRTSLRQLCAGLKFCRALLTNDSGPMHAAAALGVTVVAPFGSTSIELTGPGLPGDDTHSLLSVRAPCAPCFLRECPIDFRCMNDITVNQVVDAVQAAQGA